jgi:hypothetical protein
MTDGDLNMVGRSRNPVKDSMARCRVRQRQQVKKSEHHQDIYGFCPGSEGISESYPTASEKEANINQDIC